MNIKKIRPMFNSLLVTMDKYSIDDVKDIVTEQHGTNAIKEYQRVVAIGDAVRGVKVGDIVMINPKAYEVKKYRDNSIKEDIITQEQVIGYNFNIVLIDNIPHLLITDRDIEYIIEDYE